MFYGQFELDKYIYETFFKNAIVVDGFFVECGAFDGLTESTCKFFEEFLQWTGLNIEPVAYAFNKLIINRPKCINENCVLSDKNSEVTFVNAIHPEAGEHFGNGSVNHTKEHKEELINLGCSFKEFLIKAITFDTLIKKHSISKIDLFILDVEGHELEALTGILKITYKQLPKIFCIEHTLCGLDNLKNKLQKHYTYHSSYAHNSFFIKK